MGAVLALSASCGSAQATSTVPEPVVVDPAAASATAEEAPPPEDETFSRYGYAESVMTPFADRVTDLVLAALAGRVLPEVGVPVESLHEGQSLVELRSALDAVPEGLEVVGFGMEIDMVLRGAPTGGRLSVVLYLGPTGIRLAYVGVSSGRRGDPLPRELGEIEVVASSVLDTMRDGGIDELLLGEADRRWLDDDRVWNELARERPDDETLERAIELARSTEDPVAYTLDDLGLLLRDADGRWYSAELDFDHQGGGIVALENGPLVTLRRIATE